MKKIFGIEDLQKVIDIINAHENIASFAILAKAESEFFKIHRDAFAPIIIPNGDYDYSFELVNVNYITNIYTHSFEFTKV